MTGAPRLTPDILLKAYAMGIFPMAEGREDPEIFWVDPKFRGLMPLDGLHISRSLRRSVRRQNYDIAINRDFAGVVRACAERPETWINDAIYNLYLGLHAAGHAHSQEVWDGDQLVGGIYGVTLGAAFFGESMFSRRRDTSKIAMVYLVDRLKLGGFRLFDTQFLTEHLASLGAYEVKQEVYKARLAQALKQTASFTAPAIRAPQDVLQRNTQTS